MNTDSNSAIVKASGSYCNAAAKVVSFSRTFWEWSAKSSWKFSKSSFLDLAGLIDKLASPQDEISSYIASKLSRATHHALEVYRNTKKNDQITEIYLSRDLNVTTTKDLIYTASRFARVALRQETEERVVQFLKKNPSARYGSSTIAHLNRMLMEDAYPLEIAKHETRGLWLRWVHAFSDSAPPSCFEAWMDTQGWDAPFRQIAWECYNAGLIQVSLDQALEAQRSIIMPLALARRLLWGCRDDADLRFFVMRAIRRDYGCVLSARTVHLFILLAQEVNRSVRERPSNGQWCKISRTHVQKWTEAILNDHQEVGLPFDRADVLSEANKLMSCFLELCRAAHFLSVSEDHDKLHFSTDRVDAEYLISLLFGVPSGIAGFDQIFGGGGLVLPAKYSTDGEDLLSLMSGEVQGKVIVISGQRGTGKSILATQLASAVARRGGIAWMMAFDQSLQECEYTLASLSGIKARPPEVSKTVETAAQAIVDISEDKGALIILPASDPTQPPPAYPAFLQHLGSIANDLKDQNSLKLLIIDSMNSRLVGDALGTAETRNTTLALLQSIKTSGMNVLLLVEEETDSLNSTTELAPRTKSVLSFSEYIADVLIRLSVQRKYNYSYRYIEIAKSRLQREQRGEHAFSIISGEGIHIYPSPAAVHARIRSRQIAVRRQIIKFGNENVDRILGLSGLYSSDIVVLHGQSGSFKNAFGLCFLLAEVPPMATSLLFTVGESQQAAKDSLKFRLVQADKNGNPTFRYPLSKDNANGLKIITLPVGHVSPGAILEKIESAIEQVRFAGRKVHRIMFSNVALWDSSSPLVREDRTFAVTLIDLLRSTGIPSLFVCNDGHRESGETQTDRFVSNADCIIQFERFVFRGLRRVVFRVVKTRDMQHHLESYEVGLKDDTLELRYNSSLLRLRGPEGNVSPVPIRLFLHHESVMQEDYNSSIASAISAVLSQQTTLERQERFYVNRMIGIGEMSAVDELQLLQLDEFQLGMHLSAQPEAVFPLYQFSGALWDNEYWRELCSGFVSHRIMRKGQENGKPTVRTFHAVPYLVNLGLLAYRSDCLLDGFAYDWETIARCNRIWRIKIGAKDQIDKIPAGVNTGSAAWNNAELFFDFPKGSSENYVCLFLEILLSLQNHLDIGTDECFVRKWFASSAALKAAGLFWELTHSTHQGLEVGRRPLRPKRKDKREDAYHKVTTNAVVWRHWYSTLNQMFHDVTKGGRTLTRQVPIGVRLLPRDKMVAGEWYLGMPAYSSAPDAGLTIMKFMTTRDSELNRLRLGVGLPIRASFYEASDGSIATRPVSPYFDLDRKHIGEVIKSAFRRSDIGCYHQVVLLVGDHLKHIASIERPEGELISWAEEQQLISVRLRQQMDALMADLSFVQAETKTAKEKEWCSNCTRCRAAFRRHC